MRALILNGALPGDAGLAPIEQSLAAALSMRGWSADRIQLSRLTIAYCQSCFECWVKTPGLCKTKDCAPNVTRAVCRSDLLVLLSPVTFGGYSSEIKKALDRSMGIVSPLYKRLNGEVRNRVRYARRPSLLAIGVMDRPDEEEERIFRTLLGRNALTFHAPAHLAGFVYRGGAPEQMWRTVGQAVAGIAARRGGP